MSDALTLARAFMEEWELPEKGEETFGGYRSMSEALAQIILLEREKVREEAAKICDKVAAILRSQEESYAVVAAEECARRIRSSPKADTTSGAVGNCNE